MQYLKLLFLPFMGLGFVTGATFVAAHSNRIPTHPDAHTWLTIAACHLLFFGIGFVLANRSKPTDGRYRFGLSPGGWYIGFILTYVAGLPIGFFMA